MNWSQVLSRSDLVGGDIENREGGNIYHGPITKIELIEDMIVITSPWVAILTKLGWSKHKGEDYVSFNSELVFPQNYDDGRVLIVLFNIGSFILFPVGVNKLDPKKVFGLTDEEQKLFC